ncbi:MAG: WYL domain-containing protein [Leptospiraceae bacterium]|nr:WYL domain-containing protein [Leptospiraceae bacterium]
MKRTGKSLRRIFSLVPLIFHNQGITLERLAELAGITDQKELRRLIEQLMMFGTPPFSPSDFITTYIDEQQRVYLDFPQGLEQPLALTPDEWRAVENLIREELSFQKPGQVNYDHLRDLLKQMSAVPVEVDSGDIVGSRRRLIQEALEDELQLEFQYRTIASKEPEIRRIDPWALFQHRGVSYLLGYCHTRLAARFFHLERMQNLEILDMDAEEQPPENLNEYLTQSHIFQDRPAGFTVHLAFAPELRSVLESTFRITEIEPYTNGDVDHNDWLQAECKVRESLWFRAILRGLGPGVRILSPDHLRRSYLEDLNAMEVPGVLE